MRKITWIKSLALMGAMVFCNCCQEDVDLNHIDLDAELEMGVAVPVGSVSASIGDFLGKGQVDNFYIGSAEEGYVLYYQDTFSIVRKFHDVDLSQYISDMTKTMNVYDQLQAQSMIGGDGKITGNDNIQIRLDFPLTLKLDGINKELTNERLDSALIKSANFTSNIQASNLPFDWSWIDKVTVDLGQQIRRPNGNTILVYERGDGYGFSQDIPLQVNQFSINLMKNEHPSSWAGYLNNVVDTCQFIVHFYFTVPSSAGKVTIPSNAAFKYNMKVQFVDFAAIWGMFKPSSDMHDTDLINISESWSGWDLFKNATVPFSDPSVKMHIYTQIAGAMVLKGEYIYVKNAQTGQQQYALFNGNHNRYFHFTPQQYLPLSSAIGDTAHMEVLFDKDPERGQIDKLFTIRPDQLAYKFAVEFDQQATPQIRITPNTSVRVDAVAKLPMKFNQGLNIRFADTIRDINISQYQIDSLLADVDMIDTLKTSDLKLFIKAQNTIPVQIKGVMRCLDKNGRIIMDPTDPTKPLCLTDPDTLRFLPPTYSYQAGDWTMSEPGETICVISLDKKRFELFPNIKSIYFEASIDDQPLAYAYSAGNFHVKLTKDQKLKIKLGISAKAGAVFNLANTTK